MFQNKKQSKAASRSRHSTRTVNESFRRNTVVISKSQREVAERQQSVTQRQIDLKRAAQRHKAKAQVIGVALVVLAGLFVYRMNLHSVDMATNASSRLKADQRDVYEAALLKSYHQNTVAGQAWLLDEQAMRQDLQSKYPEIEQVNISTSAPISSVMHADVRFRQPVFIWQDASKTDQFVDKEGILFSKNLDPSVPTNKLIRIEDQSGVVLAPGSSVLTSQLVQFVGQLHSKVPPVYGTGKTISKVIIPKSTREVQIQVSGQPYIIKFSSIRNIDEEVGELAQLLKYFSENRITPSAYVDLRVAHKAFYK